MGASDRGLVALGDSITVGEGRPMLGVHAQSWALWLAQALELPYTGLAVPGARTRDVVADQLPRLRGPYAVACLYAGVNDARAIDFDSERFERDLDRAAAGCAACARRLVMCTIPLDLGRPRAAPKPSVANAAIWRVAALYEATVVELDDLGGATRVLPDAVHLTAAGQVEVAERAVRALGLDASPIAAAGVRGSRATVLRYLLTRHVAELTRDLVRRNRERPERLPGRGAGG
jgi:lysophospholipase L1-like esterase